MKQQTLQRAARSAQGPAIAPPAVHEVLRKSGEPLDRETREFMEPRFQHDFSAVRVHRDADARRSAEAVHARAYTVGSHIVLGEAPSRALLAHELAHTIQQSTVPVVLRKEENTTFMGSIGRAFAGALETAATALGSIVAPTKNWKGEKLGPAEDTIKKILKDSDVPAYSPLAVPAGKRFVLHDTSGASGRPRLEEVAARNRGSQGGGIAAYVPPEGTFVPGRNVPYETNRPTATEHEKALDLSVFDSKVEKESRLGTRDRKFKELFRLVDPKQADALIDTKLAKIGLEPGDITKERDGYTEDKLVHAPLLQQLTGEAKIYTAAAFVVEGACEKAKTGAKGFAIEGKEKELAAKCAELAPYFAERNQRVAQLTHVEIVLPGVKQAQVDQDAPIRAAIEKEKKLKKAGKTLPELTPEDAATRADFNKRMAGYEGGPENTCAPGNPYILPLPKPPYSASQYTNIRHVYFRTALAIGYFPEITTHYEVDKKEGGHCDPRCFDLTNFYRDTAAALGHGTGSEYGITPDYGIGGKKNVWWHNKHCYGAPPK